jgi:PAS domain S-box-containing protein
MPLQDALRALHELEVHRIELEMQNETLRQAQDTIIASRERYADLYDFAPVGYFAFDPRGLISEVNLTGASLLGVERSQLSRKSFSLFVAAPSRDTFHRHYRDVLQTRSPGTCELQLTRKDGTSLYVSVRSVRAGDAEGTPTGVRSAITDITERKQTEEALQKTHDDLKSRTAELQQAYDQLKKETSGRENVEAQLRQAQKMEAIGTLAGGIAHDFNNILAAIIGFSEMVLDDVSGNTQAHHKMERVLEAALRARDLVNQILDFSRKSEAERKEISLSALVKETYALLRSSLPTTIQMNLAVTTSDDHVVADPTQLQQVIMNLATNAADAMRENGGQLTIEISSVSFPHGSILHESDMEPGAYVKLTVKDTGKGMTEEVQRRIFEPFFTTKGKGKGTGMGLAVVYGVVKGHGGAVTVQSEAGQGSTFEVFLPQAQKAEINRREETTSALPTGTERILFVDDEELLAEMARGMLESLGYHVTVAQHPTEAWNLFLEEPSRFDLVITDQTMPDMTGLALARRMLKVRKDTPIILCTGYSETVSAETAKEAGISAFVMKPVVRKELAETVRRVLDGRKLGV